MEPINLCAFGLLLFLLYYILMKGHQEDFEKRFPPLSDAKFLALCKPGTDPKVALRVRSIVAENLGAAYDRLSPSTNFAEDLGVD